MTSSSTGPSSAPAPAEASSALPVPEPTRTGVLERDGQQVAWREHGSLEGIPLLHLHGGPGAGLGRGGYVHNADLETYRVIGFDQRGCGDSVPLAGDEGHDLDANTTPTLIEDIEALREHLGVDAWVLNGVSWGSTLALAYAQAHPERVLGIVLFAVTTSRAEEVLWISEGCRIIYPEDWDALASVIEREHPTWRRGASPIIGAIAELMRTGDRAQRERVALAWGAWEEAHVSIAAGRPDPSALSRFQDPAWALPFTTLVAHYWAHCGFLEPTILERMETIAHLPAYLIHGRRDVSGPATTAWELHQAWPGSELVVVEEEGHGGPLMVQEWIRANREVAERLRRG